MKITGKIAILLAVTILGLVPLAACAEAQYQPEEVPPAPPAERLPILNLSMVQDELGFVIIRGTAENINPASSSYVEVRVMFYDAEGALLDTFRDNVTDLDPGESWDFEILCPGIDTDEVKRYEVVASSAW
jgi:hypothetical protein